MGTFGECFGVHIGALSNPNEPETSALISRMTAAGDTVSDDEKVLLNNTIKLLIDNNLFSSRFDALWVTRSRIGQESAKLNWIKDAHNLTEFANGGTLTYTPNVGFNSDGINSYIKTNYNPAIHGVQFALSNASFGVRTSGTLNMTAFYTGHGNSSVLMRVHGVNGNHRNQINGIGGYGIGIPREVQLQTITTEKQYPRVYSEKVLTGAATGIVSEEIHLLKANDGLSICCAATEKLELAFIGASLTEAENDMLNSIIDNYFRGYSRNIDNAVVFTFDDMFSTDYTILYPLFLSKGVVASCNAITSTVGTAEKVTWSQISEMVAAGFDIGDHSVDHPYLTNLTSEQLSAQFQGVNDAFISNGLAIPKHGAYPYGSQSIRERKRAATFGRLTMRGNPFDFTYKTNKYQLPAFDISSLHSAGLNSVLSLIDQCFSQIGKYVILYGHKSITGETIVNESKIGTIPLSRIIDYCKNIGVDVLSQAQLYEQKLNT